jgi:hypothetical protein
MRGATAGLKKPQALTA